MTAHFLQSQFLSLCTLRAFQDSAFFCPYDISWCHLLSLISALRRNHFSCHFQFSPLKDILRNRGVIFCCRDDCDCSFLCNGVTLWPFCRPPPNTAARVLSGTQKRTFEARPLIHISQVIWSKTWLFSSRCSSFCLHSWHSRNWMWPLGRNHHSSSVSEDFGLKKVRLLKLNQYLLHFPSSSILDELSLIMLTALRWCVFI